MHYIIVWFDYIVANIVTVIPHRAHRWDTWKSGCDRLVSEPTLSELNTILMCLISMTQLHILESRQELRTNSDYYSFLSLFSIWFLISFGAGKCHLLYSEEEEGEEEAEEKSWHITIKKLDHLVQDILRWQGAKSHNDEEIFTNPRGIPLRTARRHPTGTPLGQTQRMIPTTHNLPSYLYNVRYRPGIMTTLLPTT